MTEEEFDRMACVWVNKKQREYTDSVAHQYTAKTMNMKRSVIRGFIQYLNKKYK